MVFDKTIVQFKYNIEIDLEFCVRVLTCEKRVTGKQPSVLKIFYSTFGLGASCKC